MLLSAPLFPIAQICTTKVQVTSLLGNLLYENTRTTQFEKRPIRPTAQGGWLFALITQQFEQTETVGLAQLDADTMELRGELLIETDRTGQLLQIANKEELRRKWADLRPVLRRKYRDSEDITPAMVEGIGQVLHGDGYLENVLRQGYEYGLLFPGVYNQSYTLTPTAGQARVLPRFLGDADIPLLTTARQTPQVPADVAYGVLVNGQLNEAEYPAQAVQHALRTMTDQLHLDTRLRLEHRESYEFDAQYELRHGARFTVYGVEGVLMNRTVATLAGQAA